MRAIPRRTPTLYKGGAGAAGPLCAAAGLGRGQASCAAAAMGFGDLKSAAGLRVLNDFLADKSYIEG